MLFQRQGLPIAIGIAYFFYTELAEVWPEKSNDLPSVSQSETPYTSKAVELPSKHISAVRTSSH
jgi:hypothetical protein